MLGYELQKDVSDLAERLKRSKDPRERGLSKRLHAILQADPGDIFELVRRTITPADINYFQAQVNSAVFDEKRQIAERDRNTIKRLFDSGWQPFPE